MAGPFRLLDFPDEILSLIAGHLECGRRDLCAFACVCVRVSDIADRYCYRRLLLSSEDQFERLSNAIQRKPQRLAFIQELTLVPPVFDHMTDTVIDFPHFLLVSANMLQHLTVELMVAAKTQRRKEHPRRSFASLRPFEFVTVREIDVGRRSQE